MSASLTYNGNTGSGSNMVVSTGKSVKKVLSQNMDEKEIARRMKQLEKLKVHPKDMTENQIVLERLQALYEEALPETRDRLMYHIRNFESTLAEQDPRRIRKYREFLEHMIASLELMIHLRENWISLSGAMMTNAERI